ncbi:pyridoxal phosphate-dependent aminotransferase family protein [Chloroflexi bacterium TSY]|nr:pyridoxal phosphate-dependent aminotransferase family protein [Chloroflexi bacterium TSY]
MPTIEEKRELARQILARQANGSVPNASRDQHRHLQSETPRHYTRQTLDTFSRADAIAYGEIDRFSHWVHDARTENGYPLEAYRTDTQDTAVQIQRIDGPRLDVLSFASYSFYLGYSRHPDVIAAAKDALDQYGLGSGSSPLIGGRLELHMALEQAVIDFFGLPNRSVSIFPSGFGANTGTIAAFVKPGDTIVFDEICHASLQEGAQLSGAEVRYFRHNDADHLASLLKRIRTQPDGKEMRILVGVEGCYSADGDFGKLDELVPVAKAYGAKVLVDEAHSMLMIGPQGKGMAAGMGVLEEVDLLMITFSKAFGGIGGACYATREVAQYLNFFAKSRMFSCALDPAVTAGVTRVLEMAGNADGDVRRARLHANGQFLRDRLRGKVNIGLSESWIVPVIFGEDALTLPVLDFIQRHGLDAGVMQYPAAPPDQARLRFFVTSEHTKAQLTRAAEVILDAAEAFGFNLNNA